MFHEIHRHSRRVSSSATTKDADRLWFCVALLPIIVRRVNRLVMIIENQSLSLTILGPDSFSVHIYLGRESAWIVIQIAWLRRCLSLAHVMISWGVYVDAPSTREESYYIKKHFVLDCPKFNEPILGDRRDKSAGI